MTIDLKQVLYDFEKTPFKEASGKELTMGRALANKLLEPGNENVIKFYDWAQKLWNGEKIEVDNQDLELLKSVVEKAKEWNILIKGRILTELNKVKA